MMCVCWMWGLRLGFGWGGSILGYLRLSAFQRDPLYQCDKLRTARNYVAETSAIHTRS